MSIENNQTAEITITVQLVEGAYGSEIPDLVHGSVVRATSEDPRLSGITVGLDKPGIRITKPEPLVQNTDAILAVNPINPATEIYPTRTLRKIRERRERHGFVR